MTAAQGREDRAAPTRQIEPPMHTEELAFLRSPRMTGRVDDPGHPRHRRVPTILESACEDPAALLGLLGEARIADLTHFPETAISTFMRARPSLQRRFAMRLRERLGLTRRQVAAARRVPVDPGLVMRAVGFFATTMRLADTPRVMNRDTMRRLTALHGEEALAFALIQKPLLAQSIEALREFITEPPVNDADRRMFVRALAAHGHEGAPVIALLLDLPVEVATRGFADRFDAVITGLPTLAARALTRVIETSSQCDASGDDASEGQTSGPTSGHSGTGHSAMPSSEEISAAEAQWRADGIAERQAGGENAGTTGPDAETTAVQGGDDESAA